MKKLIFSFLTASAMTFSAIAGVSPGDGVVDVEKSVVTWTGKKVTGKHTGTINLKAGSLTMSDGKLTGGTFVMDMTSITNLDMAGKDGAAKLEGHLKSADFFNAEEHPTATLVITDVVHRGTEGSYKIVGDLTIKDITKPVKFNAQFTEEGGMKVAMANVTVDRSEYNVRYGSGSFFENLGDKTIYDEFDLEIKLVLK
ncbi:MAG: YceI family protein [Saprospiraceae bacterium]|nr:YceI family protein [Saprospiraceae bacterium]